MIKFSLGFIFLFTAVMLHAQEHKHHHHHGEANEFMNKSKFEKLVERFESPEREKWQKPDEVIKFLGKVKNKTLIDIGAGTGYFAFRLAPLAKFVIATDVDERFLEFIKNKNEKLQYKNLITRKAEYDKPPLQENEADLVYSVNVYHHIENREAYFAELYRRIKKGGELVIVDFKKGDLPEGPPDAMKISEKQVLEELGRAGFKKVKVDTQTLPYQYMVKVKK
ncbi:MAG: class I SAM-dependent methyltransferase [Raineya sp.]